jgi:hypothetical protein
MEASVRGVAWGRRCAEFALVAAVAILIFGYGGAASLDDLFIYLRYVANVLNGHGAVYNVGEPSAGATSFGWLAVMSAVAGVFGNVDLVWKLAGMTFVVVGVARLVLHLRRLPIASVLCLASLTILDPFAVRWFASGMENGLVYLLVVLHVVAFADFLKEPTRRHAAILCAFSTLLPFVRPEFLALSGVVSLYVFYRSFAHRFAFLPALVGEGIAILCIALLFYAWIGFALPQTGVAKALILKQSDPLYAPVTMIRISALAIPGAVVAFLATVRSAARLRPLFIAAAVLWVSLFVYFTITNTLITTRYSVIYSAPLLCVSALALADARAALGRWTLAMKAAIVVQAAACAIGLVWMWPARQTEEVRDIRPIALWAKDHLPPGSAVALTEIGAFGFFYEGRVVDLVGLASPQVVKYVVAHGPPRTIEQLEPLLMETGATHYLETFGSKEPLHGKRLEFAPLQEWPVVRNNLSHGRDVPPDTWRLYALKPVKIQ